MGALYDLILNDEYRTTIYAHDEDDAWEIAIGGTITPSRPRSNYMRSNDARHTKIFSLWILLPQP